jgi:hypothetical protein
MHLSLIAPRGVAPRYRLSARGGGTALQAHVSYGHHDKPAPLNLPSIERFLASVSVAPLHSMDEVALYTQIENVVLL